MKWLAIAAFITAVGQTAKAAEPSIIAPESKGTFRGRPTIQAVRVDNSPTIDGHMTDKVWQRAKPGGNMLQNYPKENVPQSQSTEFRIIYDDHAMYIGVWCFDSDVKKLVALNMERDGYMKYEDSVTIVLDTFLDRRNGYSFMVNTYGARRDTLISNNSYGGDEWDGAWTARSRVHNWGWAVEIEIPLKSISFDEKNDIWGLNIGRSIGRDGDRGLWSNSRTSVYYWHASEYGNLTGLHGLKQGLGLDVNPYVLGRYQEDRLKDDTDLLGDFGADVRYRLTPSLTALASVNTDFAETESDRRQVNFTRFPLFFPEKRQFFLEDAGIFGFGGIASSSRRSSEQAETLLMPFFSRRIGLSADREVVPVRFAGKLTGRINDYNIGFMDAIVDSEDGPQNTFVGRVSRNIFEQSSVGFLTTIGDPNSNELNTANGVDFTYRNSNVLGGRTFVANAYTLGTHTENEKNLELAWGANTKLFDRNIDLEAGVMEIGDQFNPALGFVRRKGIRRYNIEADVIPYHDNITWLRNSRHGYDASFYTNLSNDVINTQQSFGLMSLYLESQDRIYLKVEHMTDRPDEDFPIAGGLTIPAGSYDWWSVRLSGLFGLNRPLLIMPSYKAGGFYNGHRQKFGLESRYIPTPKLSIEADYSLNLIDLEEYGDASINLVSGNVQYSFTPDLFISNLIQYDDLSDSIAINSRLQWEYKPGSKVFFVINQGYVNEMTGLVLRDFELVAKIGALFRF